MCNRQTPFGFCATFLVTVVAVTGWSDSIRAQDAAPAPVGRFRAGFDGLESTLMAKTELAVDQLPRQLAVKKLSELHGISIRLDEEALDVAGVKLDAPVTASFKSFTLRAALFHVLGNDDLCFDLGARELVVGVGPQIAPQAAPPAPVIRVWNNDAAKLGFEIRVMPTDLGNAAWAQINGAWIQCAPVPDTDVADAIPAKGAARNPKMQISFDPGTVRHVAFWRDRTANVAEERLARHLDRQIDAVDRVCRLSAAQREKLRLAGRGDVKRLLDRAAALSARLENHGPLRDAEEFVSWARALYDDAEALRLDLEGGTFAAKSLFAKALKRTLTPEQSATYSAGPFAEQ
jgi:hypothetical protein